MPGPPVTERRGGRRGAAKRTAWILLAIVLAFFFGIIVKHLMQTP